MVRNASLINEDFEGYYITSELGSNAFSPTFLGDRIAPTAPYQRVIIKLLALTPTRDQQRQQEILQKISVLQTLQHPHILPIIAAGIHKDMPYIMTEYQPSGSLYNRLQRQSAGQPGSLEEAFLMLVQVGQALQYAHQHQIIHGYLKPQNVLFTIHNEALVTDFQRHILLLSDEAEETDMPELSLYRAPEQLTGQTSEKSDQYALGGLAYILFTGHRPFMVPSLHTPGTYYKTRALIAPRRLNPALPLHIEEAILKAMARDPGQRYEDIAAFLTALKLPPAAGNREMRKTITALAQIMEGEVSNLPSTPAPEANTRAVVKTQLPANRVRPGGPFTFSHIGLVPFDEVRPGGPFTFSHIGLVPFDEVRPNEILTPSHSESSIAPAKHLSKVNLVTLKALHKHLDKAKLLIPKALHKHLGRANPVMLKALHLYTANYLPFLQRARKHIASRPQRTFAVMLCLVAILVALVTSLIALNFLTATKKADIYATPTANSSSQTGTVSPVVTSTGITIPSSGAPGSASGVPPQSTVPRSQPTSDPTTLPTPTSDPTTLPPPAPAQVLVALNSLFNNSGIGYAPGQANISDGYSYPANLLPRAGTITLQGIPYRFPYHGAGRYDNLVVSGQTISLTPGHYRVAYLLASSTWGPETGPFQIEYTDNSRSTVRLTVPDWYTANGVLSTPYRYNSRGRGTHPVSIYAIPIALDSTRVANALILPTQNQLTGPNFDRGHAHIFALTLLA